MQSLKKNPRNKPATAADVERAKKQAFAEAVEYATSIFLTVMFDKEGADVETIQRIGREINDLSQSVVEGYVSIADLRNVLKTEYGVLQ